MSKRCLLFSRVCAVLTIALLVSPIACSQTDTPEKPAASPSATPSPSPAPSPSPGTSPSPTPSPTPIPAASPVPLAEVTAQAEAAQAELRDIENDLSPEPLIAAVNSELPTLTREIQARLDENTKIESASPSLEALRTVRIGWQHIRETLSAWKRDLTRAAGQIDTINGRLTKLAAVWDQTRDQTAKDQAPADILRRIDALRTAIKEMRDRAENQRASILTLQNRVAEQDARVADALTSVRQAQEAAIDQLFVPGKPPLWSASNLSDASQNLAQDSQNSFIAQTTVLGAYATRKSLMIFVQICIGIMLVGLLYRIRAGIRSKVKEEPSLEYTARVFDVPVAAGLLLTMLLSGWLYPQAPRLWWVIVGAVALVPTVIVLRRLIEPRLAPILYALVGFYLMDQLRAIAITVPLVPRLLFVVEMIGALGFLLWLLQTSRNETDPANPSADEDKPLSARERDRKAWAIPRMARVLVRGAIFVCTVALVANLFGYVSLATLMGDGVLGSAYFAVILYALFRIVDGLVFSGLNQPLIARFGVVQRHQTTLQRYVRRALKGFGILLWVFYTLEAFALRAPIMAEIRVALAASLTVGTIKVSLGNVLAFGFTVWAAFFVSRVTRFLLEEDVYPRFQLARGLPYAISTMLHYVILLLGFFLAMAALGIDMTKFTILAGAFGVGLGFGLQNIVNNFVSGLILLFERPIKIGDVIQLADTAGVVEHIGIRASVVRTSAGSEVIVPNGTFISDKIINWTFSNNLRILQIPVSVKAEADPEQVMKLLIEVAASHSGIVKQPPPRALLVSFTAGACNLELHASTDRVEEWERVRSELALAVRAALTRENIAMA